MKEVFLERDRVGNSQTIALYKHGAHFKPHLEAIAVSDANSNTLEKIKTLSFHAHTLWVLTFSSTGLDALSKDCTCPLSIDSNMKDSPDILGTRAPLCAAELIESWLFVTEDNL